MFLRPIEAHRHGKEGKKKRLKAIDPVIIKIFRKSFSGAGKRWRNFLFTLFYFFSTHRIDSLEWATFIDADFM